MSKIFVILKNTGFRYSGELIKETDSSLLIDDFKVGKIEVAKSEISVRGVQ